MGHPEAGLPEPLDEWGQGTVSIQFISGVDDLHHQSIITPWGVIIDCIHERGWFQWDWEWRHNHGSCIPHTSLHILISKTFMSLCSHHLLAQYIFFALSYLVMIMKSRDLHCIALYCTYPCCKWMARVSFMVPCLAAFSASGEMWWGKSEVRQVAISLL
jgi:hypothetical protein